MRTNAAAVFGAVLSELRQQRSMTQEQLAVRADLDRTYISYLENAHRSPSLETMLALAHALQIPLSQIAALVEERLDAQQRSS